MKKTYLVVLLSLITSLGFSQMTFEGSLSHDKNPLKKDLSQYKKKNLNTASRARAATFPLKVSIDKLHLGNLFKILSM